MAALGRTWKKSSYSGNDGGCVGASFDEATDTVSVRHTRRPDDCTLTYTRAEWALVCADPGVHFVAGPGETFELRQGGQAIAFSQHEVDCFALGVRDGEFEPLFTA